MNGLIAVLMLVLAALVCVPHTAEAAIFGGRSRQVVVQHNRQQVVQQRVVRQQVVQHRVVQQVVAQPVYVAPAAVQQVYVPQQLRQQVVVPSCGASNTGVLQLNSGGCAALYAR